MHWAEDKTKHILFKKGKKQYPALNITKNENKIKQYSAVECLGCLLDENISGESMATRALKKLMEKQSFLIGRIGTCHTFLKQLSLSQMLLGVMPYRGINTENSVIRGRSQRTHTSVLDQCQPQ